MPEAEPTVWLRQLMKSTVYIETFGCQMNVADTERAATGLRKAGYETDGDRGNGGRGFA